MIKAILDQVDGLGASFIQTTFGQLASALATPLKTLLIVYVAFYGYSAATGLRRINIMDAFVRVVRLVLIVAFVTKYDVYSSFVVELATKLPDAVGNTVTGAMGGDAANLASNLSKFNDAIWTLAGRINAQGSMFSPATSIIAGIVIVVGMLFIAVGTAMIMFCKLGLWVVLALGPLFILGLMFEWTARFASGWLSAVATLMVSMILVYGIAGFILHLSEKSVAQAAQSTNSLADFSLVAPVLICAAIGAYLLTQVPMIAGIIAGGFFASWSAGGAAWAATKAAPAAVARAGVGGVAAGRAGVDRARRLQDMVKSYRTRASARAGSE